MAEALGVAASAISVLTLTAQIIDSIDKLRALHTFVKTASVEFEDLLGEIEIIQAVLRTLTPEMLALLNLPSAERRLQVFCYDLEVLILKVSKYKSTADRKLGAVKLVLKRETFRIQRQNLDNLKSTLSLLQLACYHASLSQPSRKATTEDEPAVCQGDNSNGCQQVARKGDNVWSSKKWYKNEYRIRTPLLLVDKLWTITTTNLHGWKFTMQVNNVIPWDSPVFAHCRLGDIESVQSLFSGGSASPFDCDSTGNGLLHVAAANGRVDMCRFLIENGCNIGRRDGDGVSPITYANMFINSKITGAEDVPWICGLYRLFITEAEEDLFDRGSSINTWGFSGPTDALVSIQSYSFDGYSTLPLGTRFRRAMAINTTVNRNLSPDVLRVAMGGGCIDPAAYLLKDDNGRTLLHKIAQAMGMDPLVIVHRGIFTVSRMFHCQLPCSFDSAVQLWVYYLKDAGIDLEIYGRNEESKLRSSYSGFIFTHAIDMAQSKGSAYGVRMHPGKFLGGSILGLKYGSDPKDWHLFVTNPIDELVGEFWEMVERSLEVMPGTWID
ncbi:hypothetical protein BJX65DRAFT_301469 [Aspergillus insuetus]